MIALYPLLVSNTVSKNIIPGIAKVLENYLLVYRMDDIMANARKKAGIKMRKQGKKLIRRESEDPLVDSLYAQFISEQEESLLEISRIGSMFGGRTKGRSKDPKKAELDAIKYAADAEEARELEIDREREERVPGHAREKGKQRALSAVKAKDASVDLTPYNMQLVSLEPTWMKVDAYDKNGNKYSEIIGVKVVPYRVKSDARLAHLLMWDRQLSSIEKKLVGIGRGIEKVLYRIWKITWKIASLGIGGGDSDAVSGDPRKDIILKRNILSTKGAESIFVVANQAELAEDFVGSASAMLNLQRMGWGSLIIADDVNRRASFCMTELKGLCSLLPYTMLYNTMGQAKVYEDLEDAKRTASSIFKTKRKSFKKIIGESVAQEKTIEYGRQNLNLLESEFLKEVYLIDENLGSFIQKIKPNTIKKIIFDMVKGKPKIPNVSHDKLLRLGMKMNPNFKKSYNLSTKVLGNTLPGVDTKIIHHSSIILAIGAVLQAGVEVTSATIDGIKALIRYFRKIEAKPQPDRMKAPSEHYTEMALGTAAMCSAVAIISGLFGTEIGRKILSTFISLISGLFGWVAGHLGPGAEVAAKGFGTVAKEIPIVGWVAMLLIVTWQVLHILRGK